MSSAFFNLLESPAYTALFAQHPPVDFAVGDDGNLLRFYTPFDLLTTLEPGSLMRIHRWPLFGLWSRLLRFSACFVGTTITEYAPLPRDVAVDALLDRIQQENRGAALTIIKDIPQASSLLPEEDNRFAEALTDQARQRGFLAVEGQALAYVPVNFADADGFLARLSASRRKDLRRKLKQRDQLTIDAVPLGDGLFSRPEVLADMYGLYEEVFAQSLIHFDRLTPAFFAALLQSKEIEGVVFCYHHGSTLAGYNICLIHQGRLIDKYIGFRYPLARKLNLYFISWLHNLEFAARRGLHTYVAGWTDPEVKASLGAQFTLTRHLVWIRNPLLRAVLTPLKGLFEADAQALKALEKAR